jgi:phosphate transport system protein
MPQVQAGGGEMFDDKLNHLRAQLIDYATHVEAMIDKSVKGLRERNGELLHEVIEQDEPKANDTEITLDDLCTTMIAQYEPKAKDLRTILMILKMNNDLERVADHAVNIAEDSLFLVERLSVKPLKDIPQMALLATSMLKDSITAFVDENASLARSVCERDSAVDALAERVLRELIRYMTSDPSTIERAIHLLSISRNLERIADLSTNICEDVIFMVEGKVIKHHFCQDD